MRQAATSHIVLGNGPPTIYYPRCTHQGMLYIDESTGTLYVFWNCNWVQIINTGITGFNIEVRETAGGPPIHGPLAVQNGGTLAFFGHGNTIDFSLTPGSVIVGQTAISVTFGSGAPTVDGLKTGDVYFDTTGNNVYRWNAFSVWVLVYALPSGGPTGPTGPTGPAGADGSLTTAQFFVTESNSSAFPISTNISSPTLLFDLGTVDVVCNNGFTFSNGVVTVITGGRYLISTSVTAESAAGAMISSIMSVDDGVTVQIIPYTQASASADSYTSTFGRTFQIDLDAGVDLRFLTLATGAATLVSESVGAFAESTSWATVSITLISE